ncbi:LemA family protein [Desulfosarcina variabilis str. Montpellier]|uniref:LemA family protein n=1 Tax=Desulfosarcina variabilis TaxID=2300 RepID=UPI003AFA8668
MILFFFLLSASLLIAALIIFLYRQLVRLRSMVHEGWSGVDAQLTRRADLIPNLIETVNRYLRDQPELLDQVTRLRSESMLTHELPKKQDVENALTSGLARLFTLVENYPDLKADRNFQILQHQLAEIEDQIQLTRRYYNGTVRSLNVAIKTFPSSIVARWLAFETVSFFEILQPADQAVSKVGV